MSFITYIVLDPRKPGRFQSPLCSFLFQPVYVGKGSQARADHVLQIFKTDKAKKHAGIMFHRWLLGMKDLGLTDVPIIRLEQSSEHQAFATEALLVDFFGLKTNGGILFNARKGGDGGWSLSEHSKELLSLANQGENNPNWGKSWTTERREKWKRTWKSKDRSRAKETMQNAWAAMRRTYEITDPTGKNLLTSDLTKFCKDNKLPLSAFRKALKTGTVIKNVRRKSVADGWSVRYTDS